MQITVDGIIYNFGRRLPKNGDRSTQLIIIRLLSGALELKCGNIKTKQTSDFTVIPSSPQTMRGSPVLTNFLSTYNLGCGVAEFIRKTIGDNRDFYRDLLAEFSHYFIQTAKGAHTAAFVFLYRSLERISYTVPLLYTSVSTDYIGTFNDLKGHFADSTGELGLFKKFINNGRFIDRNILDTKYKIAFTSRSGYEARYFSAVTSRFDKFSSTDPTRHEVEIKFREVPELLKSLRNRFFHTRTGDGQNNIYIKDLYDSDEFFYQINKVFCSFLAIVTLHTISKKYQV